MVQSMTGYGRSTDSFENKKITVEIRSLNSKGTDVRVKLPHAYKQIEIPLRKTVKEKLFRGKIECIITEEQTDFSPTTLNESKVKGYYQEMEMIANQLNANTDGLLASVVRFPDVFSLDEESLSESESNKIQEIVDGALAHIIDSRIVEGKSIVADLSQSVDEIEQLLMNVPRYEEVRIEKIRERMQKSLSSLDEKPDENRFEQELIYYIEKLDINEEKSRLQHHIDYFRTTMELKDRPIGKKLGFIAQEMGREINTLGSKSYHADLQKIVVNMKDHLEKIKEQVVNVL